MLQQGARRPKRRGIHPTTIIASTKTLASPLCWDSPKGDRDRPSAHSARPERSTITTRTRYARTAHRPSLCSAHPTRPHRTFQCVGVGSWPALLFTEHDEKEKWFLHRQNMSVLERTKNMKYLLESGCLQICPAGASKILSFPFGNQPPKSHSRRKRRDKSQM